MGMYTGIRFKGIVKPQLRKGFDIIAIDGDWELHEDEKFQEFSKISRASFIPCGSLAYMPNEWGQDMIFDENHNYTGDAPDTDGFERTYDEQTGRWTFQCSLKNYDDTIEEFFKLLPYFIESIEHLEYLYEEWETSIMYELSGGKIVKQKESKSMVMTEKEIRDWSRDMY